MLTHLILIFQEEKLEPLKNINDDPTIRLLNRLYAKKRKELQERQKLKVFY
jgi:S-phase kinase-associated protein 1